jgi:hypothetical protein
LQRLLRVNLKPSRATPAAAAAAAAATAAALPCLSKHFLKLPFK